VRLGSDIDPAGIAALRSEIARSRADALLLTRWREYLLGGWAARLARPRPRVVLRLGLLVQPRRDLKRRSVFGLADRIIVNAPEIARALGERPWIAPSKIVTILDGLDLAAIPTRRADAGAARGAAFRREFGIPAGAPLLVAVGSLTTQKDHVTLIRAAARVVRAHPEARTVILGEGFLRADLESEIARLGLGGRVLLTGFRADVEPALLAGDLFVLSSTNEGMSRALMEAVASGLPVVSTDVSGVRALVEDGMTGRIVPPGYPDAFAAAALELITDPARRDIMGRRARELVERQFGIARMLDETERVLFE
jgi:glycosyltransferase involved in cell wall biosynthesis